jgi:primosomal protein N'
LCTEGVENWRCGECNHRDFYEIKSGALNLKTQLGKIFPNTPIYISTADKPVETIQDKAIVIATPGVEPKITYHAIAILDCEYRVNLPYLRADELLRLQVFSIMELLSRDGYFYLDLEGNHPLVQSILKDRPIQQIEREYRELNQLQLPPIWNLTRISNGNILQLASSLAERFPSAKIQLTNGDRFLLVRTRIEDTQKLMEELRVLQKYLSMKSERLFKIERDPVNL